MPLLLPYQRNLVQPALSHEFLDLERFCNGIDAGAEAEVDRFEGHPFGLHISIQYIRLEPQALSLEPQEHKL